MQHKRSKCNTQPSDKCGDAHCGNRMCRPQAITETKGETRMRYYELSVCTTSERLDKEAAIKLSDYDYDDNIAALNRYMYKHLDNNLTFIAYREEDMKLLCIFSYDELKSSLKTVFDHVTGMLKDVFRVGDVSDLSETTMYGYLEDLLEGQRRGLVRGGASSAADNSNLWLYDYKYRSEQHCLPYEFTEKMVPEHIPAVMGIYDVKFMEELCNIENHKADDDCRGTMAHYVITAGNINTTIEMIEALSARLYAANRISSRRIEMVSELSPDVYVGRNNHLVDIIENNQGGIVAFDLTERLGDSATDYSMAVRLLAKLFKQYRNTCVFVFTYNMNHPGFSYSLLPELKKNAMILCFKEGKGGRELATDYLKNLIEASDYPEYADYAGEFLSLFPGEEFYQSDVAAAFEKFEPWAVNRKMNGIYNFDIDEGFVIERDDDTESSYEKLQRLTGLSLVKKQIDNIIAADVMEKERKKHKGMDYEPGSSHMIFAGNPGTAKTTVARLFAGIAREKGILKSGSFVMRGGNDLDGLLCVHRIRDSFEAAKGGVLLIDEAYSMESDVAITTLIQEMENHRDEVIVILAGYGDRMREFLKLNEGLKSRIPHWVDFPDYSTDELLQIFTALMESRGFTASDEALKEVKYILNQARHVDDFGNGRYVRNLLDRAILNQSVRIMNEGKEDPDKDELFYLRKEDISGLDEGLRKKRETGEARKEFEEMVGLGNVKEIIRKVIANAKLNKYCMEKKIPRDRVSLHMTFTGNPGTAKTTVARLFAQIMMDENILDTGVFVECGRADLIGTHVGETAPLVRKKFREAQGGVLFIDEAYSLCDAKEHSYGDEAINTIVQEMENNRDTVVVIFAGYPKPMQEFLERNPGMKSRIAFNVPFEDYSVDELCDITKLMLSKKCYTITDVAMEKLRAVYEGVCGNEDYGNGRFVRKMLEEAEMNLAQRLFDVPEDEITPELITTIEECDIPGHKEEKIVVKPPIGFSC